MATYLIGLLAPLTSFDKFIPPQYTPIPLERRHLTLVYLGDRADPLALSKKLCTLSLPAFTVSFRGLEPFPSASKPRYLAAVPVPRSAAVLARVRSEIADLIGRCTDRYESFRPHVSIAHTRAKASPELYRVVQRAVRASSSTLESIEVRKLCLLKAEAGAVKPVFELPLS